MKTERSWRYFGVLALALTAGAVRMEDEFLASNAGIFHAANAQRSDEPVQCNDQLNHAWLAQCLDSAPVLLARQ